ncbi:TPA: ankyrin repeat domain-containing protein [Stenotrophomonas maltophilia]|nr:ankyrin repeat domain-containing protein [Stenotrophomonas maltophilia]HDS1371789.1 ankyrin repeat domain-containing protein [Stenotrophomonas maltophilia]HDS1376385.1 ankyrin repeat domain-containing protein [Stenotrophomonas maltophilia]HDS1381239.1 ankyrin repeat domain-containing protein [Stenotrophomonas maltophilia]HDS1386013.1 ankyrin repeat domain-containing protein [Stenotrophomonas maltophilia]
MNDDETITSNSFNILEHRLDLAIKQDDVGAIQKMIGEGLDLNVLNAHGVSLLSASIWYESRYIVRELIAAGADVNTQDADGDTPLHIAAHINDIEVVSLLIDAGADINRQGAYGLTPLHHTDCGKCQELLVRNGADPTIKDEDGQSVDVMNAARVEDRMFGGQSYSQAVGTMNMYLEADQRAAEQRGVLQQAIEECVPSRQSMTRRM